MTNSQETVSQNEIQSLIATLNNPDGLKRQRARLKLVEIGRAAVPALIEIELFKALDNTFPVVEEIPWTAEAALEALNNSKE